MTNLLETILIHNHTICNLSYHNKRFVQGQIFLQRKDIIYTIQDLLFVPHELYHHQYIRCRVTYNKEDVFVEYFVHNPKNIQSFKIIHCDNIAYSYKYQDRTQLNNLLSYKQNCDEIIIIKNNMVTDCSIGNLLFLRNGVWYTPNTPLLCGTQRDFLIENQKIIPTCITKNDIFSYEKIMMINALNPFDEGRALHIDCIIQ